MSSENRLQQFQNIMQSQADIAFFPMSADLQYLTGVPRDVPNYGRVMHPGEWLEGAWILTQSRPHFALAAG